MTNAASYQQSGTIVEFLKLGIEIGDDKIISSRKVALLVLTADLWGIIAAKEDHLSDLDVDYLRLGHKAQDYDLVDGFYFYHLRVGLTLNNNILRSHY